MELRGGAPSTTVTRRSKNDFAIIRPYETTLASGVRHGASLGQPANEELRRLPKD